MSEHPLIEPMKEALDASVYELKAAKKEMQAKVVELQASGERLRAKVAELHREVTGMDVDIIPRSHRKSHRANP